ncbi:DUF4215 domain-containing protein [Sorangium sp. So ce1000]|uniref:DUF4215 domain-containing protein n=1 Tax=Sorangium sp. So ce1000 TaxID=3133325 RepID=UPI003F62628B
MGLAIAACGDDEEIAPVGATSGAGGAGGEDGEGGQGGEGGRGVVPEGKADGAACTANEECLGGLCLTEEEFRWAGGYCTRLCDTDLLPCGEGSECLPQGSFSLCLKSCEKTSDCGRAGQTCVDVTEDGWQMCFGGCDDDAQCKHACDEDSAFCVPSGEICDSAADEDEDGLQDCEERDCAAQTACAERITAACTDATDISVGGTFTGTTEAGTNLFAAICQGLITSVAGTGTREQVFKFVAPAKGAVRLAATSTEPEADFDWYIRTSCDDATTLLGCLSAFEPDSAPIELLTEAGQTYFVFIEGKDGLDASYALEVTFAEEICGDGARVGTEECDDGNRTDDDLCSNECVVSPELLCAAAAAVTEATTVGDASEGTQGVSGTCGGAGGELVYRYTPEASGNVTITATPEGNSDVVLYARSDCADRDSELACADDLFESDWEESITVAVTAGQPIAIVVDSYDAASSGRFTLTITPEE